MQYIRTRVVSTGPISQKQATLLSQAFEDHRHNRYKDAETKYRELLHQGIRISEVYANLATILLKKNQPKPALALLRKALERSPDDCEAIANLAACLGQLEDWSGCLEQSQLALTANPRNPMPWVWNARSRHALGNINEAISLLTSCLENDSIRDKEPLFPELALLYTLIGSNKNAAGIAIKGLRAYPESPTIMDAAFAVAKATGKLQAFARTSSRAAIRNVTNKRILYYHAKAQILLKNEKEAISGLLEAVSLLPDHALSWRELGLILRKQKNYPKAMACLRRAAKEDPSDKLTYQEIIDTLKEQGDFSNAAEEGKRARQRFPHDLSLLLSTAFALSEGGNEDDALNLIASFQKANPDQKKHKDLLNCKGLTHIRLRQYDQAVRIFRSALRGSPTDSGIWNNMGMAYGLSSNHKAEILCYQNAIRHAPNDHGSHMNLAMALLAQGEFHRGLEHYEWRLQAEHPLHISVQGQVLSQGEDPPELLICTEQGLGDVIQFSRFIHDLKRQLPLTELILACPDKLKGLLRPAFPFIKEFISTEEFDQSSERWSSYIPLMSIPFALGLHLHQSCAPKGYLDAPAENRQAIRAMVRESLREDDLLIAINWKGNPDTEKTNLSGRSMQLEELSLLARLLPNAVFLSVQKGHGSEELAECSFRERFVPCQDLISNDWCFVNTASYLLACDYVISTDTCAAHLSGALGLKTHLMLARNSEWRWRACSQGSEWYPNMQIHNQVNHGHWSEPIAAAAQSIALDVLSSNTANIDARPEPD